MLHVRQRSEQFLPFIVLAVVIVFVSQLPPTNDAGWQLWIGRQLGDGAVLYRDIVEINPPLWFWLAVPLVKLADLTGMSTWHVLIGFIGLSAAISLALVRCRLWGALILAAVGIGAMVQREQFTLIAIVPYIFLTADRATGESVSLRRAIAIGIWGAFGIALKPYFALVPLALEAWLLSRYRKFRPEFAAMVALGLLYVVAVLTLTPDYLQTIVPLAREAYGIYDKPLGWMLKSDVFLVGIVALLGLALTRERPPLVQALAVAGTAFLLCYLVQMKGFRYHGLPALGLFVIMAFAAPLNVLLLLVPIMALAGGFEHRAKLDEHALLCSLPRGTTVAVLSPYGDTAWPWVETCNLKWASRYMFLWMLQSPKLAPAMRQAVMEDIANNRPTFVIVSKPGRMGNALGDPGIQSAISDYVLVGETQYSVIYRRR